MKRVFTNYVLSVLALVAVSISAMGQSFDCNSNLYQVVDGNTLKVLIPETGVYQTIGSSSTSYNGAGVNVEDGYIYGIGSGDVLLKIDTTGQGVSLGTIDGFSAISYSGDFDTLGNWYSFRKSGGSWFLNEIDVSVLPPVAVQHSVTELSGVSSAQQTNDISYNPVTQKFYGMKAGLIMEFDPVNRTVKAVADYSSTADGGGYGAVWSDMDGNSYFFNNSTGNIYRAVFDAQGNITSFSFISTSAPNGNNDGMSCPLSAPPVFPEVCDNGIDDDGDGLIDCYDPDCTSTETCGISAEVQSSSTGCSQSIASYHLFFTNNSTITNTITVTDVLPQDFIFIQDSITFDGAGSSTFASQPVEGATGTISWGELTLNGGETVKISYDVSFDSNISLGDFSNNVTATVSTTSTQMFPSAASSTIGIITCPQPNVFTCEPAFYQVYKERGKKKPNMYGKLDPTTGEYIPIAIASDYANALGFDAATGLVYGASGKKFIQLDRDGLVINMGISFSRNMYRGDINQNSEWYGVDGNDVVKIDISGVPQITATYTGQGLPGWDIAYNEDGNFYSVHNQTLYKFNTTTNTKSTLGSLIGTGIPTSGGYGAQWTGSDGHLYASHNSTGSIIRVNVSTLEARVVSLSVDGLSKNDGFSCPTEIPGVYEFEYSDNIRLPLSRILTYAQDINEDNLPDFSTAWQGNTVDADTLDPSNLTADGDLDDGVNFSNQIGSEGSVEAIIGVNANYEGVVYYLIGIDWDDDGAFDQVIPGSKIVTNPESIIETISVPSGFNGGDINLRVITSESSLSTNDISGDVIYMGEVEDYRFNVEPPCTGEGCTVDTGVNGGLESNGTIAAAIAKRNFNRSRYGVISNTGAFRRGSTEITHRLASYLPFTGVSGNETAEIATPSDLVNLTNAEDVFAVDYYKGERRVAASMILETKSSVYNHSKNICDRLNGKNVQHAEVMTIQGIPMIYAEIKDKRGVSEHSIWFSVRSEGDINEVISKWNVDSYPSGDYLNFQVWSSSIGQAVHIAKHILTEMTKEKTIVASKDNTELPEVIIRNGYYQNGALKLSVLNTTRSSKATIDVNFRKTEQAEEENMSYDIALSGERYQEVSIPVGYIFDAGLSIKAENDMNIDALYLADGAWGTDFNEAYSSINKFQVMSVSDDYIPEGYMVERGFELEGRTKNVVNIFRNVMAGENFLEVNKSGSIRFKIENDVPVEVVLVEKGLADWSERMRYLIPANEEMTEVELNVDAFSKAGNNGRLEVKTIVFSRIYQEGEEEQFNMKVQDIEFSDYRVARVTSVASNAQYDGLTIYPNPNNGQGVIRLNNTLAGTHVLRVFNQQGGLVSSKEVNVSSAQQFGLSFEMAGAEPGIYVMQIVQPDGRVLNGRMMIK